MERPHAPRPRLVPLAGLLALGLAAASGCRSTKSEVPPGRSYSRTGDAPPVVGFSSDPHPAPANAAGGYDYNIGPGASNDDRLARSKSNASTFGTPTAGEKVARPTTNAYGPPGTSGVDPTAGATPGDLAKELMKPDESLTRDLKVNPASTQP